MNLKDYKEQKGYKLGALKKKLGFKVGDELNPGDLINKANEKKIVQKDNTKGLSKERLAILGLI